MALFAFWFKQTRAHTNGLWGRLVSMLLWTEAKIAGPIHSRRSVQGRLA